MPRRIAPGGYIFHVMNRAIDGTRLFDREEDYLAFERLLAEACRRVPMRILAYCLMPTHWHLVLWPHKDGDLARFMHWLATTHARRWREYRQCAGRGHLYQGPFKSFVIEADWHLLIVLRYAERNALTAGLVQRAEDWRWSSLWRRLHPEICNGLPQLSPWPLDCPPAWIDLVNQAQTKKEVDAVQLSMQRGQPFGSPRWQQQAARQLGLESTCRERGRPPKAGPLGSSQSLTR